MNFRYRIWLTCLALGCSAGVIPLPVRAQAPVHAVPLQAGKAFFEQPGTNSAQYPLLPAVRDVSVTTNLPSPYRLRSFLGGMLWGTGQPADYYNWADVPTNHQDWYQGHWRQIRLDQQTVYLNPVTVNYNWPPGQFGNDPTKLEPFTALKDGGIYNGYTITNYVFADTNIPPHNFRGYTPVIRRGINLAMPFPYLTSDRGVITNLPGDWARSPLQVQTRPLETFLLVPSNLTPDELLNQQDPARRYITTAWGRTFSPGGDPSALLVDRMGDWDADLIYQDPAHAYVRTAVDAPGQGSYLKLTMANGSPYLWCEMNDMRYALVYNAILGQNPAHLVTAPTALSSLPDVQYALISGNQDDPQRPYPGVPYEPTDLNHIGQQNNFATAAVFWYRLNPRAGNLPVQFASGTDGLGTDYLQLDFGDTPGKVFFVVALLPVQAEYPAVNGAMDLTAAKAYAEALGTYAFNFITDTKLTYKVQRKSVACSTFTSTLRNPYSPTNLVAAANTVQALLPHQYQPVELGTNSTDGSKILWQPLVPGSAAIWSPAVPTNSIASQYWTVRGSLATYTGNATNDNGVTKTTFCLQYLHNNFLAAMPPLRWADEVTAANPQDVQIINGSMSTTPLGTGSRQETVGQIMHDDIATQYMNNTAYGNAPWGTFFLRSTPDSYGVNQAFTRVGQQLGTLQLLDQYESAIAPTFVDRAWFNSAGPSPFYRLPDPNRPGINPAAALQDTVTGLQSGISMLFAQQPTPAVVDYTYWSGGVKQDGSADNVNRAQNSLWNLEYFVRWEKEAGRVLMMPNGAFPAFFFPTRDTNMAGPIPTTYPLPALQPQRTNPPVPLDAVNIDPPQNIPTDQSAFPYYPGTMWDGFGIASQFNDEHYNLGYLLAGASLAAIYDHAWETNPAPSEWANGANYGAGIDAIVQTLANDPDNPALQSALYTPAEMRASFPKFAFFDVWAGHPWASGLTPGDGLQKFGMNENSNFEGNNAWSGITLWGMATDRPAVTDLGIFLFTMGTFAGDFYFFDKNGNSVPGNPWSRVPVATSADINAGGAFPLGVTAHSANPFGGTTTTPVGTATAYQGANSIANFFGSFPQGSRLIQAYPATPWHLAIGRNSEFMRRWADALSTTNYQAVNEFPNGASPNFVPSYSAAVDQIVAFGGMDHPSSIAPFADPSGTTPLLSYWANLFLGDASPPHSIGSQGQGLLQPSQTVGTMMHWLMTFDEYGTPDFTVVGHGITDSRSSASSEDSEVFTAAFTKTTAGRPKTTLFAFNPGTQPVAVNFWSVQDTNQGTAFISRNLLVSPKKWAQAVYPSEVATLGVVLREPKVEPDGQHLQFTVQTDLDLTTLELQESSDLNIWTPITFPAPSSETPRTVIIAWNKQKLQMYYRFRIPGT